MNNLHLLACSTKRPISEMELFFQEQAANKSHRINNRSDLIQRVEESAYFFSAALLELKEPSLEETWALPMQHQTHASGISSALLDLYKQAVSPVWEPTSKLVESLTPLERLERGLLVWLATENSPRAHEAAQLIKKTLQTGSLTLNLSQLELKSLPPEIGLLYNLTLLDLSQNQLKNLPGTLSQLQNLVCLNLSDNNLQNLPDTIGELENLAELYLSKNHLQAIPNAINQLCNLTSLHLDENRLQTLPDIFDKLLELKNLNLSNNPLLNDLPPSLYKSSKPSHLCIEKAFNLRHFQVT